MRQALCKKRHLRSVADDFHGCSGTHRIFFDLDLWLCKEMALPNEFAATFTSLPPFRNYLITFLVQQLNL